MDSIIGQFFDIGCWIKSSLDWFDSSTNVCYQIYIFLNLYTYKVHISSYYDS